MSKKTVNVTPLDPDKLTPELIDKKIAEIRQLRHENIVRRAALLRLAPHLRYQPNPAQYRWLQMLQKAAEDGKSKIGILPGNSDGKSLFAVCLAHAVMGNPSQRNAWFRVPFIERWRWGKHIRLVGKATDIEDQTGMVWQLIHDWWPLAEYEQQKQNKAYVAMYLNKATGFKMSVRTFDQPTDQHDDGSTLSLVIFNEPPPPAVWNSYPARLREGGMMVACATLVRESQFFKDDVIDNPDAMYCMGSNEENCAQHSRLTVTHPKTGNPVELHGYLDHDALDRLVRLSPINEQNARRLGLPVHLSGSAFPIFSRDVHVVPPERLPKLEDCQCSILALDPHQRRPWAMMIVLMDGFENFWVVDEWPRVTTEPWKTPYHKITSAGIGRKAYVAVINRLKSDWRIRDINAVIDSKFAGQIDTDDMAARKLRERLAYEHGLFFQDGAVDVDGAGGGIDLLESLLFYDRNRPVDFDNQPRIFIADDCWNTIHQLENITWDEYADPGKYGDKRTLSAKYLDFVRLIMYATMHKAGRGLRDKPMRPEDITAIRAKETLDEKWAKISEEFPRINEEPANHLGEAVYP